MALDPRSRNSAWSADVMIPEHREKTVASEIRAIARAVGVVHRPAFISLEDRLLLVLTLTIGAIVGLVVVAFLLLTEHLGSWLLPDGAAGWRRLLIPVLGAVSTGVLLYRYFPNARGSGIPQTKTALFVCEGFISIRTVLAKLGLCAISLASGIALGREGPSVQVGAGIASALGRRIGLPARHVKALVPTGAAAALAAAFNTPISAVLFSLEEVMGDMHAPVLGSLVLSSVTSWIVLHLVLGDEPLFHVPAYQLVNPVEFVFYAALGIVGGLISAAFVKLLLWERKHFVAMSDAVQSWLPGLGGLTVGLLGWSHPQVLGVGYGVVGQALNGQLVAAAMGLLMILKLVATATCYASGNVGGIFAPSLFIGAMVGGAVGGTAHCFFPDYTSSAGAYALVGMGAVFAGTLRVPLTSVIMIFEITRDYSIIGPLMVANLVSYFLSSKLQQEPIYEALQRQNGVHPPRGARARAELLTVQLGFRNDSPILQAAEPILEAAKSLDRQRGAWPVLQADGLRGMVTVGQLEEAINSGRGNDRLSTLVPEPGPSEDLSMEAFPHVHLDHSLDFAMEQIATTGVAVLPVVSRTNIRELQGTISVPDIQVAYRAGHMLESQTEHDGPRHISIKLLFGISAALATLAVVGGVLYYFSRGARGGQTVAFRQAGNKLLAQARYDEAIAEYRNALSASHSVDDRLALALALTKAGAPNEASLYWYEVLQSRPHSGLANLALARINAEEERIDEAISYFMRAIDGSWAQQPDWNRLQARTELLGALVRAGRTSQANAEIRLLIAQLQNHVTLQKRVGLILMNSGMLKESMPLFHDIAERNPRDAAAYAGLGEALFRIGEYAAARDAFRKVLSLNPSDRAAYQRIQACDDILAFDSKNRGLSAARRYARSREILSDALSNFDKCSSGLASARPEARSEVTAARTALARKLRPLDYGAAESNLAMAKQLWMNLAGSCGPTPEANDLLDRHY